MEAKSLDVRSVGFLKDGCSDSELLILITKERRVHEHLMICDYILLVI